PKSIFEIMVQPKWPASQLRHISSIADLAARQKPEMYGATSTTCSASAPFGKSAPSGHSFETEPGSYALTRHGSIFSSCPTRSSTEFDGIRGSISLTERSNHVQSGSQISVAFFPKPP